VDLDTGLSAQHRAGSIGLLNKLLANEYVLYVKTRNYHWNVTGPQFNQLHLFFESQYEELSDVIDEVAERCRAIGGNATGTLEEFKRDATLTERAGVYPDAADMVLDLLGDHEAVIRSLREDIETTASKFNDAGTGGFLNGLLERHEKMAWMLRVSA
jgi:starvation-inducible DNA-binding protein